MPSKKNNSDNLIPTNKRTKAEARELGRRGGIASGKARAEKKLLSQMYGSMLADTYDVNINGVSRKIDGQDFFKAIAKEILQKRDSSSVSMLKEIREATEGDKVAIEITESTLTPEQRAARIKALESKRKRKNAK